MIARVASQFNFNPRTIKAILTAFVGLLVFTGRLPKDGADVAIGLIVVFCATLKTNDPANAVPLPPDPPSDAH